MVKTVLVFLVNKSSFILPQDKEIYLLDDPLAAVDAHVAAHLFQHCIMGLLKNKTRILCTHHTHFLSAADQVVVMDHGAVVYTGPLKGIQHTEEIMQTLIDRPDEGEKNTEDKNENSEEINGVNKDEGLVKEEEKEMGVVKLHVYKSYWLAIGHCVATSILLSLFLMQGENFTRVNFDFPYPFYFCELGTREGRANMFFQSKILQQSKRRSFLFLASQMVLFICHRTVGHMFSRSFHRLHTFSLFLSVICFPALQSLTSCFPALARNYVFMLGVDLLHCSDCGNSDFSFDFHLNTTVFFRQYVIITLCQAEH